MKSQSSANRLSLDESDRISGRLVQDDYVGSALRDREFEIPAGIDESEVEVIAEPCDRKGVHAIRADCP